MPKYRLIIAGSRGIVDPDAEVANAIARSPFHEGNVVVVLSGGARGVDRAGERWARQHGIPVRRYRAAWSHLGRRAGPVRNEDMARNADALLAIWDGESPGTRNMMELAYHIGLNVYASAIRYE